MDDAGRITVGVVDDDNSVCKAVGRLLRGWNMRAATYSSAESFFRDADLPSLDCLILDIHLPGMTGFDVQREVRNTGSTLPIIFLTADDVADSRDRALKSGAEYLRKEEPGVRLQEAILRAVGRPR